MRLLLPILIFIKGGVSATWGDIFSTISDSISFGNSEKTTDSDTIPTIGKFSSYGEKLNTADGDYYYSDEYYESFKDAGGFEGLQIAGDTVKDPSITFSDKQTESLNVPEKKEEKVPTKEPESQPEPEKQQEKADNKNVIESGSETVSLSNPDKLKDFLAERLSKISTHGFINENFEELKVKVNSAIDVQNQIDQGMNMLTKRNATLNLGFSNTVEILTCYGCWCNRGIYFERSRGIPRDGFDKICKYHHMAYQCIRMDSIMRGEECDPVEVSENGFRHRFEVILSDDNRAKMRIECDHDQDWCAQRTCEADVQYLQDFVDVVMSGGVLRRDLYGHNDHFDEDGKPTGNFDWESSCRTGVINHTPYRHCCGKYPRRKTYASDQPTPGGLRDCCDENGLNDGSTNGKVYYPDSQSCCSGVVHESLTCPSNDEKEYIEVDGGDEK